MKFNISYTLAQESDKAPGDGEDTKLVDKVPVQVDATPGVAGDDLKDDTDTSAIVPHIDTLLEIEKDMLAAGPDEGIVDGFSEAEAGIEEAVAIECELNAIATELTENDRVMEIADGLTDVQTIVQATPDGEVVDLPMLQTAANMAVAGTDADAQDILPAMEAFRDKKIAMEALGEKIAGAVSSVLESLQNIYAKTKEWLKKVFTSVGRLEEALKQRQANASKVTAPVSFQVKGSTYLQKDQKSYVANTADFIASLDASVKSYGAWSNAIVPAVAKFDGDVKMWWKTLLNKQARADSDKILYDAYVNTFTAAVKGIPGLKPVQNESAPDAVWLESPALLGGVKISAYLPKAPAPFGEDKAAMKKTINTIQAILARDYVFHEQKAPVIQFTVTPQDVKTIIALDLQLLKLVKLYLNAAYKRQMAWSEAQGAQMSIDALNTVSMSIIKAGINLAVMGASGSQHYGNKLLRSSFIVLDKAIAGNAAPAAQPAAA